MELLRPHVSIAALLSQNRWSVAIIEYICANIGNRTRNSKSPQPVTEAKSIFPNSIGTGRNGLFFQRLASGKGIVPYTPNTERKQRMLQGAAPIKEQIFNTINALGNGDRLHSAAVQECTITDLLQTGWIL